ncbi:MAG: DUF2334 domain-containing protein [Candidatus Hydrothermarchaeota archaeon]|nr:DUF2334 domain-containing protein [Candidatus Hydrothermarchaeota archaeon]
MIALAAVAIVLLVIIYLTRYYYRDLLFGPTVDFEGDSYIEIGLYPGNCKAAFVFTCDDANALTKHEKVARVLNILDKYNTKAVFFLIPFFKGRHMMARDSEIVKVLKEAEQRGHEVAQHGLTHATVRRRMLFFGWGKELGNLPYSEQKRRIKKGRRILEQAGFTIHGFRSPAFSASIDTLKALDSEEFLYASDTRIRPIMLMSNKRFCESLYYPYHPGGLGILDFTSNGDYFWGYSRLGKEDLRSLKHRFNKFYENNGTFVLLSHIEPLNRGKGLKILEEFLKYTQAKSLWKSNLRELAEWWKAREALFAVSEIKRKTLVITLEKGSEYTLKNLTIKFKQGIPAKNYEIFDANGAAIKKGKISESIVLVDV